MAIARKITHMCVRPGNTPNYTTETPKRGSRIPDQEREDDAQEMNMGSHHLHNFNTY